MTQLLDALEAIVRWMEAATPAVPLGALLLLAAGWLAARRAVRFRERPSAVRALVGLWAEMLALSCLLLLGAWAVSRLADQDWPGPFLAISLMLLTAALAPPAHALRCTLLRVVGRPGGGRRSADVLRCVAWLGFAAVMLVWTHALAMRLAFPMAGGELHAMFAYSAGRLDVALLAWATHVVILGLSILAFAAWIPFPWWATGPLAAAVGLVSWWQVVDWYPQTPRFHQVVVVLFVAMPFAILGIVAAGARLRRVAMRSPSSGRMNAVAPERPAV